MDDNEVKPVAKKAPIKKDDDLVEVECIRAIGVMGSVWNGIPDMAGPGSVVKIKRVHARVLQEVGAVKIPL